ncbi:octanoyl-[GcvH]:protein N-octanoyltransferase [Paenibacillus sp. UNCCL117]|uniref:lipoate--protein ligase family protein n=1 Tax=unclassified Paenibacillus TaxID=185978 RepID=UPI000890AAA0|nr:MULTISPECIES: lipoate--protein ligase family protein [unclassified Paenibacillus]SDD01346.1 octanoyl-[GcvH]:protein N-octanoyltransferase [Paenibacillus sp. cl123]SFW32690.1 octanoyl-[GcvH]:protein N-octanoyltransferase [Paenibacillus sp. UNCCL117]
MIDQAASLALEEGLHNLLLLDRSGDLSEPDILYPFALEELLCRHAGEGGPPMVHIWRHPRAFVMGLRDSRLPEAAAASSRLKQDGYRVAVRNSGGAAVPLDLGVVNVSLIGRKPAGGIDFHDDFEKMYGLIALALKEAGMPVNKGEIAGAYCPGDFDLSIGGRKFCGIAQRRQQHAYVVQAFVVVEGSGAEKAAVARSFYDHAAGGGTDAVYPRVSASSMASLTELLGPALGRSGLDSLGRAESERQVGELNGSLSGQAGDSPAEAGLGPAQLFIDAVKRVIRERQSPDGIARATEKLWLPEPPEVRAMAQRMRERYGIAAPDR